MTYREDEVATLGMSKKHCFACANILDARAELCPKCGVRQPHLAGAMAAPAPIVVTAPPPTTTKNKTTAGLLALFFGGIGVHKFYLGQGGLGVVYLLYIQIEAYVLTPRVMNKTVSVPGLLVVIGALAGGTLLGLLGALVAVPATASAVIFVQYWS